MNILNRFTWKCLLKNRTRTLVTIIGIILSAAMITAVTTSVSSLQRFMLDTVIETDGDWHGAYYEMSDADLQSLSGDSQIESLVWLQSIGYARLEGGANAYKPYLFIGGMGEGFEKSMPVNVTSGRLPQNAGELLIPEHVRTNGGVILALGDQLTLEIGERRDAEGAPLNQRHSFAEITEDDAGETLITSQTRTYTVVGFYSRPSFEPHSAPGYTALTVADYDSALSRDVYYKLKSPRGIYDYRSSHFINLNSSVNRDYLTYAGYSDNAAFNGVLYSLAEILIGIIMFGSISLIYNSFSISVSERTKQFGLLSSVGATRRQMLHSVLFEALVLSGVGVPLGILAGMLGIAVTFKCTEGFFSMMTSGSTTTVLHFAASWPAVVIAALVGLGTVLISAYLPARRAVKVPAIDAIRQTPDVNIRAREVRTSRLTGRLFGFEGVLASKNFKRNRKKYRATVFSLFMSVVLFISASSFCAYLNVGLEDVVAKSDYDLVYRGGYYSDREEQKAQTEELFAALSEASGIKEAAYCNVAVRPAGLPVELLSPEFVKAAEVMGLVSDGKASVTIHFVFVDEATYGKYVSDYDLSVPEGSAVVLDLAKYQDPEDGRYYTCRVLREGVQTVEASMVRGAVDGYEYAYQEASDAYVYINSDGEELRLNADQAMGNFRLNAAAVTTDKPFCADYNYGGLTLIYPYGADRTELEVVPAEEESRLCFTASDSQAVYNEMSMILESRGMLAADLYNYASSVNANRALVAVINVFSYGFITLISLIACANVFNTISTNILLRRREFAMLKSIGMTRRGFNKMMNFECILYGVKGLILGIPAALGVTWLIYQGVRSGWEAAFFVPWYSIAIAVGSVFAVVFATMLFAMCKIKRDNPIDALRNENL